MKILGIHDGHNAAAALLSDGKIAFAIEEERITRIKNDSAFPKQSIRFLLDYTKTKPADIDKFVFSSNHIPGYRTREGLMEEYRHANSLSTTLRRALKFTPAYGYAVRKRTQARRDMALAEGFTNEQIVFQDHHLSHAAAAYYGCPWWKDERVLVLTIDGGGDGLCATVSIGENGKLRRLSETPVSESLGYLYSMVTFLLGMVPEEHEYKLMGMAPYASVPRSNALAKQFRALVAFDEASKGLTWRRTSGVPEFQYSHDFLKKFLDLQRFDTVCGGLQEFVEEFVSEWVRNCIRSTGIRKVAMSGGVLMNVKANKRILELPDLEQLFVYPTCGDPTNSMGAAYEVQSDLCRDRGVANDLAPLGSLYWGPEYSNEEIKAALDRKGVRYQHFDDIEIEVAERLFRGEVVARFKGRMEFGARALGNRSILGNPAKQDVIRTINDMIKNRDFWMPFAPSMIAEEAEAVFVNPKKMPAPYMIMSFDSLIAQEKIYAAAHPYDKTVRPQMVYKDWNPDYHRLISHFKTLSGTGVVLNTSFNLHGFPIVFTPEDAIEVFQKSGLQNVAVGNYLARKD